MYKGFQDIQETHTPMTAVKELQYILHLLEQRFHGPILAPNLQIIGSKYGLFINKDL